MLVRVYLRMTRKSDLHTELSAEAAKQGIDPPLKRSTLAHLAKGRPESSYDYDDILGEDGSA